MLSLRVFGDDEITAFSIKISNKSCRDSTKLFKELKIVAPATGAVLYGRYAIPRWSRTSGARPRVLGLSARVLGVEPRATPSLGPYVN